ncbi:MAG: tail fiber domain-containing protein [Bacteroidota bacterium]
MYRLLKGFLATLLVLTVSTLTHAQVAINTTGDGPDNSAMLDVSSNDKGILIPRMDSTGRIAILNPADGLMVYDTTTTTFWYYDEEQWNEIRNGSDKLSFLDLVESLPEIDLSCPETISSLNVPTGGNGDIIEVVENYAYVRSSGGVSAINITELSNPFIEGTIFVGSISELNIQGQYAFSINDIGNEEELVAIDISDPTNMVVLDEDVLATAGVSQLATTENVAYILQDGGGLDLYDISDPANLNAFGFISMDVANGSPQDMTIEGDYLYVIDREFLEVVDISNPANPNSVGSLSVGNDLRTIAASGSFVCVIDRDGNELKVIDVSVPSTPSLTGSLVIGGLPTSVKVAGNYAYVTVAQNNDLKIIDISDASNPVLITSFAVPAGPADVFIANSNAYVASSGSNTFSILELSCPDPAVFQIDPLTGEITATNAAEIQDDLGNHTATMDLDMANFSILNVNTAQIGSIDLGTESVDQSTSNQAGNGFTTTPWVYTNAVEAQGERGTLSTLITIGDDGTYGSDDQIHLVTNGNSHLQVGASGNTRIGTINIGSESTSQNTSNQAGNGFTVTPWVYTNAIEAQGERTGPTTLITVGNDGVFGADDQINLVTRGEIRFRVNTNGNIEARSSLGVGTIDIGSQGISQASSNQNSNGFTTTPWVYSNAIQDPNDRGNQGTLITLGNDGVFGGSDQIHLVTGGTTRLQINPSGRVGIGRNATARTLEVNGNASKNTPGPWAGNSDARLKKNIEQLDAETTLEKLLSLQGITYEWDDDQTDYERPTGIQYGFTAQNIQQVFPTLVEEDAEGYLQTAYGTYDAMYVEAFRALLAKIENLQAETDRLSAENQQLQQQVARIQEIEATLASLQQQLNAQDQDHSATNDK